jgi:hypothetical protein
VLWPPNGKLIPVTLSGMVSLPAGCSLEGLSYQMSDSEGGPVRSGALSQAGMFSATILVQASRLGDDPAGRTYTFTVTATDRSGSASESVTVTVPHDQGN